jgi:WD40 repeat protein
MRGHLDRINALAVSRDGKHVVSASHDRTLRVWNLDNKREVLVFGEHEDRVFDVALTQDGRRAFSVSGDRTARVWDIDTGKVVASFTAETEMRACATMPGGKGFIAGDASGQVHFFRLE